MKPRLRSKILITATTNCDHSTAWQALALPSALEQTKLMGTSGYVIAPELPNLSHTILLREAVQQTAQAQTTHETLSDLADWRGGSPERRFMSAQGGTLQDHFYRASATQHWLRRLTGLSLAPTGERGTFTYYRPGDYLGLHRDIIGCDVALITCLADTGSSNPISGALHIYPDRWSEPLSTLRRSARRGCYPLNLAPGQSVIFLGGVIPHRVAPLSKGQLRIVSLLCFSLVRAPDTKTN